MVTCNINQKTTTIVAIYKHESDLCICACGNEEEIPFAMYRQD